jgi:hypothetical protein
MSPPDLTDHVFPPPVRGCGGLIAQLVQLVGDLEHGERAVAAESRCAAAAPTDDKNEGDDDETHGYLALLPVVDLYYGFC